LVVVVVVVAFAFAAAAAVVFVVFGAGASVALAARERVIRFGGDSMFAMSGLWIVVGRSRWKRTIVVY
jgi:hypothetical protein